MVPTWEPFLYYEVPKRQDLGSLELKVKPPRWWSGFTSIKALIHITFTIYSSSS